MRRKPVYLAFTKPRLLALQPEAERRWIYDTGPTGTPGLAVMVAPGGRRSYYYVKKARGRVERVRIGSVAELSVDKARKRAAELAGAVAVGRSPSEERRAVRAEITLGELWAVFVERHGPRKRSIATDKRRYNKHLAAWAGRKLSSIDRTAVVRLLDSITTSSGPGASNRTRALLHSLYAKAIEWGAELHNPVSGTPRNRETAKERYLSPDELRRFLAAVDEDHDEDARDFLRLLLFTGVRRGSLCAARWEDINLKDRLWRIPAESMKAGRPLELPLAGPAVAILAERQQHARPGPWVFPAARSTTKHTIGFRTGWLQILVRAQITGVTEHDLRRTHATYAMEAGVPMAVIARTLGHTVPGGVTGIYARVTPGQLRDGVERAVSYLLAVAKGGAEVLPFHGAGVQA